MVHLKFGSRVKLLGFPGFARVSASNLLNMTGEIVIFCMSQNTLVMLMANIKGLLKFLLGLNCLMKAIKKILFHGC